MATLDDGKTAVGQSGRRDRESMPPSAPDRESIAPVLRPPHASKFIRSSHTRGPRCRLDDRRCAGEVNSKFVPASPVRVGGRLPAQRAGRVHRGGKHGGVEVLYVQRRNEEEEASSRSCTLDGTWPIWPSSRPPRFRVAEWSCGRAMCPASGQTRSQGL